MYVPGLKHVINKQNCYLINIQHDSLSHHFAQYIFHHILTFWDFPIRYDAAKFWQWTANVKGSANILWKKFLVFLVLCLKTLHRWSIDAETTMEVQEHNTVKSRSILKNTSFICKNLQQMSSCLERVPSRASLRS